MTTVFDQDTILLPPYEYAWNVSMMKPATDTHWNGFIASLSRTFSGQWNLRILRNIFNDAVGANSYVGSHKANYHEPLSCQPASPTSSKKMSAKDRVHVPFRSLCHKNSGSLCCIAIQRARTNNASLRRFKKRMSTGSRCSSLPNRTQRRSARRQIVLA